MLRCEKIKNNEIFFFLFAELLGNSLHAGTVLHGM